MSATTEAGGAVGSSTTTSEHGNLWRDPLALAMLCAFNGISVDQAPPLREWSAFANPSTARAWGRVADAARLALSGETPGQG